MRLSSALLIVICSVLGACSSAPTQTAQAVATDRAVNSGVEEIYIVRSLRQTNEVVTPACDAVKIGFENTNIDAQFLFRSIATRPSDGRLIDASIETVGNIHTCQGTTSDPNVGNFYGEGQLGGIAFRGSGTCQNITGPEKGLRLSRCFLDLKGLPDEYTGGRLTTNTMNSPSKILGETTDPPGYIQSSIATVRLWKRRS
jgi:hypothetical protein